MKVNCNRAALFEAVQLASSVVPARTPKPILQCAKLDVDEGQRKLTVLATDNELSIKCVISQVEIHTPGSVVVPAHRLAAILRESADETVSLEVMDATCQILGHDSRFHIYGHDPADYPVVAAPAVGAGVEIEGALLKRMIQQTAFAAARENSRYAINGVLWEQRGKKLRMVATDGRRLALVDGELAKTTKVTEQAVIISVKTMMMLERILNDPNEQVHVDLTGERLNIRTTLVELSSTLVQGRFPKYAEVIPASCNKKVVVATESLRSAVRRVALLTNEQSQGIHMSFSKGKLRLSSSTPEAGDAEVNMEIEYEDDEFRIGFNPHYILEMLRVLTVPEITCEFIDDTKPGLVRAGQDFLYVLMPVTV